MSKVRPLAALILLGVSGGVALSACSADIDVRDLSRHNVTLTGLWDDPMGAAILTSQKDVSAAVCGNVSTCVSSLSSDQAQVFKFRSEEDADSERREGDVQIREIFIVRWTADVPQEDREYVEYMLLSAGNST